MRILRMNLRGVRNETDSEENDSIDSEQEVTNRRD